MFNRRNAFVGYLVMKLVGRRARAMRNQRLRAMQRSHAARYAQRLARDEPVRAAISLSLVVGVLLGALAWLASGARRQR